MGQPMNRRASCERKLYEIGREYFGLSFCGFVLNTIEECLRGNVQDIYFVAREGFLFQRIYNMLCKDVFRFRQFPKIRQHFLFLSRISTALASVQDFGPREIILGYWRPNQEGLHTILKTFDLDPAEVSDLAARHGFANLREPIQDPFAYEPLQGLLADRKFQERVRTRRDQAKSMLRAYLAQQNFFVPNEFKAIVDIGWNCTIQANLSRAFGQDEDFPLLWGFYYGRHYFAWYNYAECSKSYYAPGFAYDQLRLNPDEQAVGQLIPIFEMAAAGPSGTTIGFYKKNGRVRPVFRQKPRNEWVAPLQKGIFDYARWFASKYDIHEIDPQLLNKTAARKLARLVLHPTREEAEAISLLVHDLDWGTDDKVPLVSNSLHPWSIFTPRRLRAAVRESIWKEGALRLSGIPFATTCYSALSVGKRLMSPIFKKG